MSADAAEQYDCSRIAPARGLGRKLRSLLGLAVVLAGFSLHPAFLHTFWSREYLPNIMQQAATNIIVAVGMTFVILTGGIDLSVGSVLALCGVVLGMSLNGSLPAFVWPMLGAPAGVVAASLLGARLAGSARRPLSLAFGIAVALALGACLSATCGHGVPLAAAIAMALALGGACGMLNGLFVTQAGVPPFVASLGMLTAARGLTVYATGGNSISSLPEQLGTIGRGLPLVTVAVAVVVLGAVALVKTGIGRQLTAIGGNEEAARLAGIDVASRKTLAYVVCGVTAAIAAVVLTAKFRLADTGAGVNAELNAIAAVVIGGGSLSGGRASVFGSFVGALTIAVLNAGLVLVGMPDTLQGVVIGAAIVCTVCIDQWQREVDVHVQ